MFKIELSNGSLIKDAFDAISTMVDEVVCVIDNDGFRLTAMDRSHISFVSLDLKPTVFDEFECTVPEKVVLDTDEFMKVLKRMKNSDILRLTNDEGNLIIRYIGDAEREFKIRFIDSEYDIPQPPTLEPPVAVTVPSGLMKDALNKL